jgi:hypothetical protein
MLPIAYPNPNPTPRHQVADRAAALDAARYVQRCVERAEAALTTATVSSAGAASANAATTAAAQLTGSGLGSASEQANMAVARSKVCT